MKIFKYTLKPLVKQQTIGLPFKSKVIHVNLQKDNICIWVLFSEDDEKYLEDSTFYTVTTGESFTYYSSMYIGTVQMKNGIVYHIFRA